MSRPKVLEETGRRPVPERCAHAIFEGRVRRSPETPALVSGGRTLTYRELDRRANQLARFLRRLGVGPEVIAGVALERSFDMVTAVLGVLKAGGAYLPLDPGYPEDRLRYMIEDSGAKVLVTREATAARLLAGRTATTPAGPTVVCLDRDAGTVSLESGDPPEAAVSPGNLAYVIYTSGSTGRPKGVLVEHRGLANLAEAQMEAFGLGPADRILQFSSLSFDASVFELVMAWRSRGCLYLADSERVLAGPDLVRLLSENRITVVTIPPSVLATLPEADFPDLRCVIVAGEACPPDVVATWAPGRRFFNAYGPTETTVWATVAECASGEVKPPIGRAVPGVTVHLLDESLRPVPCGVVGELYIGGVGVARGYLGRPDLTAERFVPDPFSGRPGARLYRTGDLVREREDDGQLEYVGRVDHQVKIRGFRVELGEIEATLWEHPAVRSAVVDLRGEGDGARRLVAYVVPAPGEEPSPNSLRVFLRDRLPDYMVPSAFITLDRLPLLPSGKVDRRALPPPSRARPELDEPFVAPRTPAEEVMAAIWAEVLGLDEVGVNDDFFALGGDSLLATRIVARARQAFGAELPLASIFTRPSVARLADAATASPAPGGPAAAGARPGPEFPPIRSAPRDRRPLPLSLSQERVWFLQKLEPTNLSYNAQATMRVTGRLQVEVLERALTEVVRRHEILRTTFPAVEGRPVQVIHEPWAVSIPVVDLGGLAPAEREAELERVVAREIRRKFDMASLPLIRWILVRLGPEDHVLVHVEHHLIHDGWSFGVLLGEVKALYEAFLEGRPSPLGEVPVQFAHYAVWQREWAASDVVGDQVRYWVERLEGAPPVLELPTDRPRPPAQTFRGAAVRTSVPGGLAHDLRRLSRREGVTLFMTFLAAFAGLLHRYSGQNDFCLGSGVANRRWRELEGVIGMVINTVALRFRLSPETTFRDLLAQVREVTLGAYANQDLPFDRVVEALQPERTLSYLPIYQVVFGFHDSPMPEFRLGEAALDISESVNNGSSKFDLSLIAIPRSEQRSGAARAEGRGEVTLVWEYSTDLFDKETAATMSRRYVALLEAAVADPGRRLGDFDLLTPAEREWVRTVSAGAENTYPVGTTVRELVEAQARQSPDRLAVTGAGRSLSYGELDCLAQGIAGVLSGLGVGPETVVAVCAERTPEMVAGLLAVWKAGGAYLPIDPDYPRERMAFMLEDTRAPVLLTQRSLLERLPETRARLVLLDDAPRGRAAGGPATGPGSLAYVIYTSGSTGRPKGVMVEHRTLQNLVAWHRRAFEVSPDDRASQAAGLGFDASVWEIWPYLTAGASLHLVDEETRISPIRLQDWLVAQGITVAFVPTPLAEAVLPLDWPPGTALRLLLTGGDRLHTHPAEGLPFTLVNNYGPTENTVVATSGVVPPAPANPSPPSIGRPIENNRAYILDSRLRPVPPGVPGELYLGGLSVARGYLARPDLTAESFLPDPFDSRPGARMYRTGDLARFLRDGSLEFRGRADHQVKIRGHRIELGEIEAALLQHPEVKEAVVRVWDGPGPQDRRLVAYLVFEPGSSNRDEKEGASQAGPRELGRFLARTLPDFMVPSAFVTLEALPLDPNGKVDRRGLPPPPPAGSRPGAGEGFAGPRTPVEATLAEIWSGVLGVPRVGVHDNFFALGGHSLMAARVIARAHDAFGLELPLSALFRSPTVAELAAVVEESLAGARAGTD
ncbi:MAG: amino acid adenylation domain-containing protein [Bacillota bacterium]